MVAGGGRGTDTIIDLTDAGGDQQSDDGLFASDPSEDGDDKELLNVNGSLMQGRAELAMEWEDVDMQTHGRRRDQSVLGGNRVSVFCG